MWLLACVALDWFEDRDGDGFGGGIPFRIACVGEEGEILDGTDCDDDDPAVSPGATEICNWIDDDCDDELDDDAVDAVTGCLDRDRDNHGATETVTACDADASIPCDDCDDTDRDVSPARWEVCDEFDVDEDCDGLADGADARNAEKWYADGDGDGYGDATDVIVGCESDDARVDNDADCDDTDPSVHADAAESCDDLVDQDCDGRVDESCNAVRFGSDSAAARVAHAEEDDKMFADLVAAAGDVTGDGRPDLAVTSPHGYDVDRLGWVFEGTVEGDVDTSGAVAWFADTANFVAGVGDVDGDGFDDLAGGDALSDHAIAIHRSPLSGTLTAGSAWSVLSAPGAGGFIADAGDLDGDGRGDFAAASFFFSYAVYAVSGLTAGGTDLTALPAFNRTEGDGGGVVALTVLDDDGDGLSEMFVGYGSTIYGVDLPLTGDVALEDARAIKLDVGPNVRGPYLADAGDWDGDGDDDLGAGSVVLGPTDNPDGTVDLLVQLTSSYAGGRAESAAAGDFDGDGRTDIVIAVAREDELAFGYGLLAPRTGAVDVEDADFLILATGRFGGGWPSSVTSPGDTDGDGADDILIASPLEPGWNRHEGAAWLFRGGDWLRP